jgi:putative ABC transport system permease protein
MSGAIALAALLLGTAAGWAVVDRWFKLPFRPDWVSLVGLPLAGIAVAVVVALVTAWPALRARPAEALRSL